MKDANATVIVELNKSEEEILNGLHKDARWGINRAKKDGLIVEESSSDGDWQDFYKAYTLTQLAGENISASLEELKNRTYVFFVCKKEGKVIAGAGIWFSDKYDEHMPRLYFNASLKDYQRFQPNNLLYWHCILWCKKNGYPQFDLGGWQINARGHLEGINRFKEKWGKIIYFEKEYSFVKAIGRKLVRNSAFFRWAVDKIKKRK